jgi:hypothetical protein
MDNLVLEEIKLSDAAEVLALMAESNTANNPIAISEGRTK